MGIAKNSRSVKVPEEVLIVERPLCELSHGEQADTGKKQGYVVFKDNGKSLENAAYWAGGYYGLDECPKEMIHEYRNGQFTLALAEAAEDSYRQGGKLSFWNCEVTAEDGQTYLIGINSELLLDALLHNTFANGVCLSKVYLGRKAGQTGVFTENMPSFALAKEIEREGKRRQSSGYGIGQIVYNKAGDREAYLSEMYKKALVYKVRGGWRRGDEYYVAPPKKPKPVYVYAELGEAGRKIGEISVYSTKRKMLFDEGDLFEGRLKSAYEAYIAEEEREAKERRADYDARPMSWSSRYVEAAEARLEFDRLRYGPDDKPFGADLPLGFADAAKRFFCACHDSDGVYFVSEEEFAELEAEHGRNGYKD